MKPTVYALLQLTTTVIRSRLSLQLEIVALRHQLAVYQRTTERPRIGSGDRIFWSWLSRHWPGWRDALVFVQTGTVIAWQRKRFREHWAKLSQSGKPGRPQVPKEIRELIRKMSEANVSWGSPRIVGELHKLGIDVAKSTVEKYRVRSTKPPSPTWKAFLNNHVSDLVSIDFFVVPTVKNKVLFVLVVLAHHRRRVVHFNVTEHPTAQWTAQQITEAFPWETAPKYLLRDRDAIYGRVFQRRVRTMGIEEVLTAPRSPWQKAFVERIIGSIRRDCLDHVVVLNDPHLKRILASYFTYYHRWRTHLSLEMDSPESRSVQSPALGKVVQFQEVGGLHHHYERMAA
jgi:transposase InsO family protein